MVVLIVIKLDCVPSYLYSFIIYNTVTIATKIGEATPTMASGENALCQAH